MFHVISPYSEGVLELHIIGCTKPWYRTKHCWLLLFMGVFTANSGAPLGLESGAIPDSDISASSAYDFGIVGPQHGRSVHCHIYHRKYKDFQQQTTLCCLEKLATVWRRISELWNRSHIRLPFFNSRALLLNIFLLHKLKRDLWGWVRIIKGFVDLLGMY